MTVTHSLEWIKFVLILHNKKEPSTADKRKSKKKNNVFIKQNRNDIQGFSCVLLKYKKEKSWFKKKRNKTRKI